MPAPNRIFCFVCQRSKEKSTYSFHRFPQNDSRKTKWMAWGVTHGFWLENDNVNNLYICSCHFQPHDFKICTNSRGRLYLKHNAVPSIGIKEPMCSSTAGSNTQDILFSRLENLERSSTAGKDSKKADISTSCAEVCSSAVTASSACASTKKDNKSLSQCQGQDRKRKFRYLKDFRSEDMDNVVKAKRFRHISLEKLSSQTKQIKSLRQRNKRLTNKINNVEKLLNLLKSKNMVSDNAVEHMLDGVPNVIRDVINRKLKFKNKKSDKKYEPEIRKFALTLQFYSSRAYNYVRKIWGNLLPHPSTIKNWYSAIDGKAGFTRESFRAISVKCQNSDSPVLCNIVIDEMKIKDEVVWSKNKFYGNVDMGTEFSAQHENATRAAYALVFMAVGLNQGWKIPIGYFFIKSLAAEERANLLTRCFELMHDTGAVVNSITFDGASTNLSMVNFLGANLSPLSDKFQPWFLNPVTSEKVFVFLDPSHMLKLMRNVIGDLKVLIDSNGDKIKWEYIENLVQFQEREGLHLANKLSKKHINFQNNRMSVKLAGQVLSQSTSNALLFLKQQNIYHKFFDSEATAKFCLQINNAFDILNCHSKFSKKNSYCIPLNNETKDILKEKSKDIIEYLKNLKDSSGTRLLYHPRKTGVLGLILCLHNIFELYDTLSPKGLEYLLSFKLSQDFIETFFGAVRSRGGWNVSPNAKQFETAYKRLLVKNEISASEHSNCLADGMEILSVSSQHKRFIDPVGEDPDGIELTTALESIQVFNSTYVDINNIMLNPYVEDIAKYIGGAIVAKLKYRKFVECTICLKMLIQPVASSNTSVLTILKNRGPFLYPSNEVNKICAVSEQTIRGFESRLFEIKHVNKFLSIHVFRSLGIPFNNKEMDEHILGQSYLDNHRIQITKLIIDFYVKIRLYHFAKLKNEKDNLRQKYSNLAKFKGK